MSIRTNLVAFSSTELSVIHQAMILYFVIVMSIATFLFIKNISIMFKFAFNRNVIVVSVLCFLQRTTTLFNVMIVKLFRKNQRWVMFFSCLVYFVVLNHFHVFFIDVC